MLSSLGICRTSCSLHLLLQNLLQPWAVGTHLLLPRHGLSQKQAALPFFSVRSGRESSQRDGALKYFARFLTDETKPKLRQGAAKNAPAKIEKLKEEGPVHSSWDHANRSSSVRLSIAKDSMKPATRVTILNTDKNEGPARKKENIAQIDSELCEEIYSVVIKRKPTKKFLHELQQKLDFLHSASPSLTQVKILLSKTRFLSASPEMLMIVVHILTEFFESESIALAVLTANTGILAQPIDTLKQRLHILAKLEVDREACIKLGTTKGMWTLQAKCYEERLSVLKEVGMDSQARNRVIQIFPRFLSQTERSLRARMEFWESVGLHGPKLLKFLKGCPRGFSFSVDKSLMARLSLVQSWGLSANVPIGVLNVLLRHSKERLGLRYKFFKEQGLSHKAVIRIFRLMPSVLSKSTESLKTRVDFLVHELNRDISEGAMFPAYFGYSFEGRIVPRFRALEALGLSKKVPLASVLSDNVSVFKIQYNIPDSVNCS